MRKFTSSFLLLFALSALSAQVNLGSGLVAYYPFSASLDDVSVYQNHAVDSEDISFVAGRDGEADAAVYFDGTTDAQSYGSYVEIPNAAQLNFQGGEEFTISFWLKASAVQNNTESAGNDILSKWGNAGNQPYSYVVRMYNETHPEEKGVLSVGVYDGNFSGCAGAGAVGVGFRGETPVNDGIWHHVIFTREADGMLRLFVDGNLDGMIEDVTTCNLINASTLTLGTRHLGNTQRRPFTGTMDELRFYDRQLTADEREVLAGIVNTGTPLDEAEDFTLFPNPVDRGAGLFLTAADGQAAPVAMQILTLDGRFLQTIQQGEAVNLPSGVYLVQPLDNRYGTFTKKLTVID